MPLTQTVTSEGWVQLTSVAGAVIAVRCAPQPAERFVELLASVDDPGAGKVAAGAGDDGWVISTKDTGVPFFNLGTSHLWARARDGNVKVYASESLLQVT